VRLNPERFDSDQWVAAAKAGGFDGFVLTTKHHDRFCNWPTETTNQRHCTAQAEPSLTITAFAITGSTTLGLSWDSVVVQNYQVQYRNDLERWGWTDIGGVVNSATSTSSVELPYDPQQPQRFFRVVEVP